MTPVQMAQIHQSAFLSERPWQASEFTDLLSQPFTQAFSMPGGFALTRTLAGESELLTLAVSPDFQRQGIAQRLLTQWLSHASTVAESAFLEVAADNTPACALYEKLAFRASGLRKGYYARSEAPAVDAVLMTWALTSG